MENLYAIYQYICDLPAAYAILPTMLFIIGVPASLAAYVDKKNYERDKKMIDNTTV